MPCSLRRKVPPELGMSHEELTWSALCSNYLDAEGVNHTPRTIASYRSLISRFIDWLAITILVTSIRTSMDVSSKKPENNHYHQSTSSPFRNSSRLCSGGAMPRTTGQAYRFRSLKSRQEKRIYTNGT